MDNPVMLERAWEHDGIVHIAIFAGRVLIDDHNVIRTDESFTRCGIIISQGETVYSYNYITPDCLECLDDQEENQDLFEDIEDYLSLYDDSAQEAVLVEVGSLDWTRPFPRNQRNHHYSSIWNSGEPVA